MQKVYGGFSNGSNPAGDGERVSCPGSRRAPWSKLPPARHTTFAHLLNQLLAEPKWNVRGGELRIKAKFYNISQDQNSE